MDLETAEVDRLAEVLPPTLEADGQLVARTADLEDVERWRRAARRAGLRMARSDPRLP